MKIIKYYILQGHDENNNDILLAKVMDYSENNIAIVEVEAYNGEYTIEDNGIETVSEPTQLDRIESQIAYLAMMTGNSDILEAE